MSLQTGKPAPHIKSGSFDLAKLRGKTVVLFFFPKADTPGCTKESCAFRDAQKQFTKLNAEIVGISPDEAKSQEKFATKYGLPYAFVPDPDHKISEAYGVWKEKSMYGRTYMGIERTTFLISADGVIKRVWNKVKVTGHAAEVLKAAGEV
jgi:peroxiredoxin Q/BCP